MKNIMKRAWEIAKEGQEKFGGKVSEYLSESLKMAWAEEKEVEKFEAVLPTNVDGLWIAEITGAHPKFKMNREFLNDYYIYNNFKVFDLSDGVYEGKFSNRNRSFFQVVNGEAVDIDYKQALELAEAM